MPRIRTIKPEFWDSPDTAAADLRTRLLYIAMWNWADDYGIGDATPVRLIGFAFPNDEIPVSDYPRILSEVSRAYGVVFFEHSGRRYFVIPEWEKHQRTERRAKPNEALIEPANAAISAAQRPDAESPRNSAEIPPLSDGTSGAGTGEQGNRGTGEKDDDSPTNATHHNATTVEAIVVENAAKPARNHPSSAARTVVRQTLGYAGYPRSTITGPLRCCRLAPVLGRGSRIARSRCGRGRSSCVRGIGRGTGRPSRRLRARIRSRRRAGIHAPLPAPIHPPAPAAHCHL